MIVIISHLFAIAERFGERELAQKHRVSGRFPYIYNVACKISATVYDHGQFAAHLPLDALELVVSLARLKAERAYYFGIAVLRKHGHRKLAGFFYALVGVIIVINADREGSGLRRYLNRAICDTSLGLAVPPRRYGVHAVR